MNGCIIKGTPIVVDVWDQSGYNKKKVHFLSHLHADHTKGLTKHWKHKFYTSPLNCALVKEKFDIGNGVAFPLELDEPHIVILDEQMYSTMTVTLIEANHVPGAVLFLFQGSFGNILYSGDMRFYPEIFKHPILQQTLHSGGGIDQLYLDNTFCHHNYNFPSRKLASQQVLGIIEQHPKHTIKLGVRTLGKEDLLEEIAMKFNEVIHVDEPKYKQLKLLKRPNVYTTDISQSRIHALSIHRLHLRNHQKWNETNPTISIRLSAIDFGIPPDERPLANTEGCFTVPYSDHSSWSELMTFVAGLKPRKIFSIVKHDRNKKDRISLALVGRDDMSVFKDLLSSPLKIYSSSESDCVNRVSDPVIDVDFEGEVGAKKRYTAKRKVKRGLIKKGVFFSSFNDENDDLTTDSTDLINVSSSTTNMQIDDKHLDNIISNDLNSSNSNVKLDFNLSSQEIKISSNCESLYNEDRSSFYESKNLNNYSCCLTENRNSFALDNYESSLKKRSSRNKGNFSLEKNHWDKLIGSAHEECDNLLMLMQNNSDVDTLVSHGEMLAESLSKVDSYLINSG